MEDLVSGARVYVLNSVLKFSVYALKGRLVAFNATFFIS